MSKQTVERNGVRRPIRGITAAMWALFDSAKSPITGDHIKVVAEKRDWNLNLTRSHFRQWKLFNERSRSAPAGARKPKAAAAKKKAIAATKKTAVKKAPAKKAAPKKTAPTKAAVVTAAVPATQQ